MAKEAELGISKNRRRVDINEEYYRLAAKVIFVYFPLRKPSKAEAKRRTWRIGKTKESKDYQVKTMEYDASQQI